MISAHRTSLRGMMYWHLTSGTSAPRICTGETIPQNIWLRKQMKMMSKDPKPFLLAQVGKLGPRGKQSWHYPTAVLKLTSSSGYSTLLLPGWGGQAQTAETFSCSLAKVCKYGQLTCSLTLWLGVLSFSCSKPKADVGIEKAPSYYIAEVIFPAAFLKQKSKPHPLRSPATRLKRASMQSTQRILLGHQALVAKGAGIPDLLDTVTI